jgi:nitrite reductase (NADH) small subunit
MNWIKITEVENIPLREGRPVEVAGKEIAVFRLSGRVVAIDNRCPHNRGPLCDGITTGEAVVCPLHGWKISLETGQVLRPDIPLSVRCYPTRVEDGIIEISLESIGQEAWEAA